MTLVYNTVLITVNGQSDIPKKYVFFYWNYHLRSNLIRSINKSFVSLLAYFFNLLILLYFFRGTKFFLKITVTSTTIYFFKEYQHFSETLLFRKKYFYYVLLRFPLYYYEFNIFFTIFRNLNLTVVSQFYDTNFIYTFIFQ
jgi:hypothetical protein